MSSDTLLVLAGDRKSFDKWTRTWGVRLKNTSVVMVRDKDDTEGWDDNTYYTVLPGYSSLKNSTTILEDLKNSDYKEVSAKTIESRLKNISIKQQPTQ